MPPASHAVLSASSAHRWLRCPPSALACASKPDTASEAALQGTAAHELAEWKLRRALQLAPSFRPVSDWQDLEMEEATDDYACFIQETVAKAFWVLTPIFGAKRQNKTCWREIVSTPAGS